MAPQWDGAAGCACLQGAEDIDAPPALRPVLGGERTGAVGARRGHPCISRLLFPLLGFGAIRASRVGVPLRVGVLRHWSPHGPSIFPLDAGSVRYPSRPQEPRLQPYSVDAQERI